MQSLFVCSLSGLHFFKDSEGSPVFFASDMDESGRQNDCSYRSQIETCGRESEIVDNNSKTKFFGQLKYGDVHRCLFFVLLLVNV